MYIPYGALEKLRHLDAGRHGRGDPLELRQPGVVHLAVVLLEARDDQQAQLRRGVELIVIVIVILIVILIVIVIVRRTGRRGERDKKTQIGVHHCMD